MLAAFRAGSPTSFGSLAALALVGRLLPFPSASGARLLVSLRPAIMSFQICTKYHHCGYSTVGMVWPVQNFGREVIVCVQLRFSIYYNYADMKSKAGIW